MIDSLGLRVRAVAVGLLLALASVEGSGCARAAAAPVGAGVAPRSVARDAGFYQPPVPLPQARPGTLIRSEPFGAPVGYRAWRMLYHSRDERGVDRVVSGFVVIGDTPAPPGGRPVVAAGSPVPGVPAQCAPSRAASAPAALVRAARVFAAGAAYVATDDPGIGTPGTHPYLVGETTGRAVLDAARAAAQVPGVGAGHEVILQGQTLGGQAALYAAALAHRYAPDLHVLGVAVGTPQVQVSQLLAHLVADTPFGVEFLLESMAGLDGTVPEQAWASVLTATGRADLALLGRECDDEFSQAVQGQSLAQAFTADPLRTRPWSSALAAADPPVSGIGVPVLVTQAQHDNAGGNNVLYPITLTDQYVRHLCQRQTTVEYRVYPTLPHNGPDGATPADPDIVQWMLDRLAGKPARSTCG